MAIFSKNANNSTLDPTSTISAGANGTTTNATNDISAVTAQDSPGGRETTARELLEEGYDDPVNDAPPFDDSNPVADDPPTEDKSSSSPGPMDVRDDAEPVTDTKAGEPEKSPEAEGLPTLSKDAVTISDDNNFAALKDVNKEVTQLIDKLKTETTRLETDTRAKNNQIKELQIEIDANNVQHTKITAKIDALKKAVDPSDNK